MSIERAIEDDRAQRMDHLLGVLERRDVVGEVVVGADNGRTRRAERLRKIRDDLKELDVHRACAADKATHEARELVTDPITVKLDHYSDGRACWLAGDTRCPAIYGSGLFAASARKQLEEARDVYHAMCDKPGGIGRDCKCPDSLTPLGCPP